MSLIITCPVCGKRDGYEFRFGGEERGQRPCAARLNSSKSRDILPREWSDYVRLRSNVGSLQEEWWYHREGCGTWFTIQRDTLTNLGKWELGIRN